MYFWGWQNALDWPIRELVSGLLLDRLTRPAIYYSSVLTAFLHGGRVRLLFI